MSFLMPRTLSIDRDLLDRRALSTFTVFLGYAVFEACIAALSLKEIGLHIYIRQRREARFFFKIHDLYIRAIYKTKRRACARAFLRIKYYNLIIFLQLITFRIRIETIVRNNYRVPEINIR